MALIDPKTIEQEYDPSSHKFPEPTHGKQKNEVELSAYEPVSIMGNTEFRLYSDDEPRQPLPAVWEIFTREEQGRSFAIVFQREVPVGA